MLFSLGRENVCVREREGAKRTQQKMMMSWQKQAGRVIIVYNVGKHAREQ